MDRYKNNVSYKKDVLGVKNKTENWNSFTKSPSSMMSSTTTKKTSFSTSSNNYGRSSSQPDRTQIEAVKKKEQNPVKITQPIASYNNNKPQSTQNDYKSTKPKQDVISPGLTHKGDQNQSKTTQMFTNYNNQTTQNDYKIVKPKQEVTQFGVPHKGDQNQTKTLQSVTSYNNSKHQATQSDLKIVKPKQDATQLCVPHKGDENQSKISQSIASYNNSKQQATQNDQKIMKPKQDAIQLGVSHKGDQNQSKTTQSIASYNNSKPKQDLTQPGLFRIGDQNSSKTSQSLASYNNTKQQATQNDQKIVKSKQELGASRIGDQNPSKVVNSLSNYNGNQQSSNSAPNFSKYKQGGDPGNKSEPNLTKTSASISASQIRDVRQDDRKNEVRKREKFIADYAANLALIRTIKHMWQSPNKGKYANATKNSSYVASEPKSLKRKPEEPSNSNFATPSFWDEQTTNKIKSNAVENFFVGQSKLNVKVGDKAPPSSATLKQSENSKMETQHHECREINEQELRDYLLKEPALTALYIGLPADQIKQVIREKLKESGTAFTSANELVEAVLTLQKENQGSTDNSPTAQTETCEKSVPTLNTVPSTATETTLSNAEQEEGHIEDRKMLEEIRMLKEEKICKICLDAQVGVVFVPCGHLLSCVKCCENIKICPLCRVEIQSTVKTFLS